MRGGRSWRAAACRLLITALLACALPEARAFRRLRAAGNRTDLDDWEEMVGAAKNITGPLALLHPRLVVFGDSISSVRGTSLVVRKALGLTHLVRAQHGCLCAPPLAPCLARCPHADVNASGPLRCALRTADLTGQ